MWESLFQGNLYRAYGKRVKWWRWKQQNVYIRVKTNTTWVLDTDRVWPTWTEDTIEEEAWLSSQWGPHLMMTINWDKKITHMCQYIVTEFEQHGVLALPWRKVWVGVDDTGREWGHEEKILRGAQKSYKEPVHSGFWVLPSFADLPSSCVDNKLCGCNWSPPIIWQQQRVTLTVSQHMTCQIRDVCGVLKLCVLFKGRIIHLGVFLQPEVVCHGSWTCKCVLFPGKPLPSSDSQSWSRWSP